MISFNCGKGLSVFFITFALGILISIGFVSNDLTIENNNQKKYLNFESKNCVPLDKNLKYEKLPLKENSLFMPVEEDEKMQLEKPKEVTRPKVKSTIPKASSTESQNLLHKVECYEY
jgi:hypothetical protein